MSNKEYTGIGQMIYTGEESFCFKSPIQMSYADRVLVGLQESTTFTFEDTLLKIDDTSSPYFMVDNDYYFNFNIYPWKDEDVYIDILLVNIDNPDIGYQFLKTIVVPKTSIQNNTFSHEAIIYQKKGDNNKDIHKTWVLNTSENLSPGDVFKDSDEKYYIFESENSRLLLDKQNYSYKIKTFSNFEDNIVDQNSSYRVEGTFSPLLPNKFNGIRFRVQQTVDDFIDNDGGRFVELNGDSLEIYPLNNLLENKELDSIKKIGVWGSQGLRIIINGEEVRIGPTGYYEMDLLPINRLGVAINPTIPSGVNDFTIDYLY